VIRRRAAAALVAAAVAAAPLPAQAWDVPEAVALAERAARRRADPEGALGLAAWRAKARGTLAFLGQFGDTALMPPLLVKAAQVAVDVSWRAPGISRQVVVGLRDTALFPGDIGYYRDRYGIVQGNFPDRIRLGEGRDVSDIVHPFSSAGLARYRFAVVDSQFLSTGRARIAVLRVAFRPRLDDDALAVGAAYLDRESAEIVRLELTFTPAAILDKRIERLSVVLENGLVEGKWWLPRRQELDVQRVATWLDVPARGIVRGRWEIADYEVAERPRRDTAKAAGPELVFAAPESLRAYAFDGPVLDPARANALVAGAEAVRDVRKAAEEALLRRLVPPQPRARAAMPRLSELVRVTRAEGLAFGAGVAVRPAGTATLRLVGRYGLADRQAKGTATFTIPLPVGGPVDLVASRDYADAGDVVERSLAVNSLAAQEFGQDMTQPVDVRRVGARLVLGRWAGLRWSLDGAAERHDPVRVLATPVRGSYNPTLPAVRAEGVRASLRLERPSWMIGERGSAALRGESRGLWFDTPSGRVTGWRGSVAADLRWPLGDGFVATSLYVGAVTGGGRLLPQQRVLLGGPVSGPGYGFHTFAGTTAAFQRIEYRRDVTFAPLPLARYGRVPGRMTLAPYAHAVFVDGQAPFAPRRQGWYPSLGVGGEFFMGLMRVDVARGLRGGGWMLGVDVGRVFWGIL
jgi:hypothetical protein